MCPTRRSKPDRRVTQCNTQIQKLKNSKDKFALLWGEAQKKIAYSYPRVTYSYPKVTCSDPKVTHSDPTHLPLPPLASPGHCLAIS